MDSNFINRYQISLKTEKTFGRWISLCINKIISGFILKGQMITEVEQ